MTDDEFNKLDIRLRSLEQWQNTENALGAERRAQQKIEFDRLYKEITRVHADIGKVNNQTAWIVKLVIAGLVSSFIAFIVNGGIIGG